MCGVFLLPFSCVIKQRSPMIKLRTSAPYTNIQQTPPQVNSPTKLLQYLRAFFGLHNPHYMTRKCGKYFRPPFGSYSGGFGVCSVARFITVLSCFITSFIMLYGFIICAYSYILICLYGLDICAVDR